MPIGNGVVGRLAIIRAVCRHGGNVAIHLIEQFRQYGNIANIVKRQFCSGDLRVAASKPRCNFRHRRRDLRPCC
jgi:hypothetical protein